MNPKALLYNCAIEIINTIEENSFLKKENEKLKKDLKEYQDMLKLMSEGHMTIHPKKD